MAKKNEALNGILVGIIVAIAYPILALLLAYVYSLAALIVPLSYLFLGIAWLFIGVNPKPKKYDWIIVGGFMTGIAIASILSMLLTWIFFGRII